MRLSARHCLRWALAVPASLVAAIAIMAGMATWMSGGRSGLAATLCFGNWNFDIADVDVPTYIWLGEDDIFVSKATGQHLKDTIPVRGFHLVSQRGHFNIENWHDIFEACAKHIP